MLIFYERDSILSGDKNKPKRNLTAGNALTVQFTLSGGNSVNSSFVLVLYSGIFDPQYRLSEFLKSMELQRVILFSGSSSRMFQET